MTFATINNEHRGSQICPFPPALASEFPVLLEIPPSPEVFQILPHFLLFHRFIFYIYVFSSSKIYIV